MSREGTKHLVTWLGREPSSDLVDEVAHFGRLSTVENYACDAIVEIPGGCGELVVVGFWASRY